MDSDNESDAKAFNDKYFIKLYPLMIARLRAEYGVVRMVDDMTADELKAGVKVGSAFLTTFSHFRRGEFDGLTEAQMVAEFAHIVFKRWRRSRRARDSKHVSYSASGPDEERSQFEPAVDSRSPEDEAQVLEYFREVVGKVRGQLTADNPRYLSIVRAYLEQLGTQQEIAQRCGCKQATVSRALSWLYDTIRDLQTDA